MDNPATFRRLALPLWTLGTKVIFFLLAAPLRCRGGGPPPGGCLVLCNHLADVDPFAIMACSPRPIRFMGKEELFAMPVIGRGLRYWGVFPVRRGEPDRAALRRAAELIQGGWAVGVFPEGQLSESGHLQPLLPGISLIARLALPEGCPVVCCALSGTNRVMRYGSLIPCFAFGAVRVHWGEIRVFTKEESAEIPAWCEGELRRLGAP